MELSTKICFVICVAGLFSAMQAASSDHLIRRLSKLGPLCLSQVNNGHIDKGLKEFHKCWDEVDSQAALIVDDAPFNIVLTKYCDIRNEYLKCWRTLVGTALSCDAKLFSLVNALINIATDFLNSQCTADRISLFVKYGPKYFMNKAEQAVDCSNVKRPTINDDKFDGNSTALGFVVEVEECRMIDQAESCFMVAFEEFADDIAPVFHSIRNETLCSKSSGHRVGPLSNVLIAITLLAVSMGMIKQ